ncbi:PREDICTED: dehydrodolichyl diphosphate synthase 6 [Theobroma cacao]|uniref:Alkyl transferase n=1 Tax=Theobroma cacao TaxID=3641 RepID=A0AB32VVX7_THECC|nr:PREDICTED: dehydrodolichyl diphosphate synthase 6 [Theobroma cacao]
MEKEVIPRKILSGWIRFVRKCFFRVLRVGPIPSHIAVIMDGNRRYAKKKKLEEGAGHDAGALALLCLLIYCYELGVKHLSAYAFSIDNFRRKPEEVQKIMDLLRECIPLLTRIVKHRPIRVHFAGSLELLSADIRIPAKRLMDATADNSKFIFTLCVVYTSTDEIMHVVQESCKEKCDHIPEIRANDANNGFLGENEDSHLGDQDLIKLVDIEKHMYMAITPDPDILIRTGDEHRLSNFLLWQTSGCQLSSLVTLWPEIGIWQLVWVVLNFQRNHHYYGRKRNAAVDLVNGSYSSSSPPSKS